MKPKIFLIILSLGVGLGVFTAEKEEVNELTSANIEALAQGESPAIYLCYGLGTIDCYGGKVEFMIDNYRLK
ncbi:NVEALA domain-containing protein [Parabacteroides sp. OttesenSCG-928-B22]|nr:NVEALA domain-containing protein [Parabacteroides sp. OttesenSCG-928-B22]